jgi:glycerol-3-phosphate O-acyltransferase/dihydroxyacetone phosphate acyltransferase
VLLEFGQPSVVGDDWAAQYDRDNQGTVRKLTDHLAESLRNVTLNAPDWRTLRFVQAARRLYKPATAELTPGVYVELSRRFVDGYLKAADDPEMARFRDDVEDYQSRLEMLGLKDHQLRKPVSPGKALSRLVRRALTMLILLPIAIPGALLHLPVGWIAAVVGERFSYEMDDVATLKVFATISILPLLYLVIAVVIGNYFGIWWAIVSVVGLTFSFFTSVRLIEAEASLFVSIVSILRLTRLRTELEDMRATRARLVTTVRTLADRLTDPSLQRIFSNQDFAHTDDGE